MRRIDQGAACAGCGEAGPWLWAWHVAMVVAVAVGVGMGTMEKCYIIT